MSWRKKLDPNKRLDWGHYEMTKEDREAMYWCHANGIVIHEEIKKDGPWPPTRLQRTRTPNQNNSKS